MSFMGIIICGLNGTGKNTLGKALAEKLHFHFIGIENLYFHKTNTVKNNKEHAEFE